MIKINSLAKINSQLLIQVQRQIVNYSTTKTPNPNQEEQESDGDETKKTKFSPRVAEFQKKLREKTPIGKLDEVVGKHPYQEKEPLEPWPNNTNPKTGEIGGPAGPEPTRYGDWERKGRVSDF